MKTCKTSIILSKSTKPIKQTRQKKLPKPYSNIIYSNLNKNSKIKKSKAVTMKYLRKTENSYLFLKFEVEMKKKNGAWREHGEFVREMNGQDNE